VIKLIRTVVGFVLFSTVVLSCSVESEPTLPQLSPTSEPDFVRVTVTAVPIDTPTPTPATQLGFTAERLAAPVFPDWLDPDIASERPTDEEIIQGWKDFLSNTVFAGWRGDPEHLCEDGTTFWTRQGSLVDGGEWQVARSPAVPVSQWGIVTVVGKSITRQDGKFLLNEQDDLSITRSVMCLERATGVPAASPGFTAEQLADPVFPDWLDPDIATEQPSDEEIISGWTEFVTDAVITVEGQPWTNHSCADGTLLYWNFDEGVLEESTGTWNVRRNAAIPSSQWGTVKLMRIDITRSDGKFWGQNNIEFQIARSVECLGRTTD